MCFMFVFWATCEDDNKITLIEAEMEARMKPVWHLDSDLLIIDQHMEKFGMEFCSAVTLLWGGCWWSTSWSSCRAASLSEIPCDSYHGIRESLGSVAFDSPAWPALSIYLYLCLPDGLSLHPNGPSPLKRRVLPSRTTQRADNSLSFWHQDSNNGNVDSFPRNVRDSAHTRRSGGLCDSLCKQNPLETFVDANDKSRRFTGPPAPSERPHGGSSITQQERHKEDQGMKAGETSAMWARGIRGNSEWASISFSFPLRWGRGGCLCQIEREEGADQEVGVALFKLPLLSVAHTGGLRMIN